MQPYATLHNLKKPYGTSKKRSFTLIEILVALAAFGLAMTAAGGAFYGIYNDWRRQRNYMECIENARWAMEFMGNEIRYAIPSPPPPKFPAWARLITQAGGNRVRFGRDTDGDNNPDIQIQYERSGNILRRRWRIGGAGPWQSWQELGNFIVPNTVNLVNNTTGLPPPDGNVDPIFIANAGLVTITLTVRPNPNASIGPGNRDYTLRTRVRIRN